RPIQVRRTSSGRNAAPGMYSPRQSRLSDRDLARPLSAPARPRPYRRTGAFSYSTETISLPKPRRTLFRLRASCWTWNRLTRVAKAQKMAFISNLACGVIQANRMYKIGAGRVPCRKKLLKVAQRDPGFGRDLARAQLGIREATSDDVANAVE